MSQIAAGAGHHGHAHDASHEGAMRPENITLEPARASSLSHILLGIGGIGALVTLFGAYRLGPTHALAAYHVGVMVCLALGLGALFFTLAFHLVGAGWSVTVRRQFENLMSMIPVALAMVAVTLVIEIALTHGALFRWMNDSIVGEGAGRDLLLTEKSAFLNPIFFLVRAVLYTLVWVYLVRRLWGYSTEQDRTGDRWLTNRARFTSAWGMLLFALTTAFAAFDWLMSIDYRFFSTMWGVYYFAGAAFSSVPTVVIVLACLQRAGKLRGAVTEEHLHDLGKLMFAFTVFWAYIAFSQYFLIWYSNIPEETSFFLARKTGGWNGLSTFLCFGHFLIPFFILLWRRIRRSFALLSIMAAWAILMHILDIYWIVRPMVYAAELGPFLAQTAAGGPVTADPVKLGTVWLDIAGVVAALGIFSGLLVRRIGAGPLVPTRDPRLAEALSHRNYV